MFCNQHSWLLATQVLINMAGERESSLVSTVTGLGPHPSQNSKYLTRFAIFQLLYVSIQVSTFRNFKLYPKSSESFLYLSDLPFFLRYHKITSDLIYSLLMASYCIIYYLMSSDVVWSHLIQSDLISHMHSCGLIFSDLIIHLMPSDSSVTIWFKCYHLIHHHLISYDITWLYIILSQLFPTDLIWSYLIQLNMSLHHLI